MPDYTAPSSSAIEDNAGTPGLASGITEAEIRSLLNIEDADFIAAVEGEATLALAGSVTVATGQTFVSPRLPAVTSVSGALSEGTHAGRYNICSGGVTLPSTSTAGEHYAILNTTGGDITIARNGNNINGAGSDFTLGTNKAATCIAIGSNNWMVVG